MDCGDEEDCDFDHDFIRRPKFYHSTPRLSDLKDNHRSKLSLSVSSCENVSPVDKAPVEYFNPFTPDGKVIATKVKAQNKFKRLCISQPPASLDSMNSSKSDSETSEDIPRRPRLKEMNVSRLYEEFIILEEIGKGDYGSVFKCLNRMNGCVYAVKKTLKPIKSDFQEKILRNEIYAHGILIHPNVVCNFSCWIEEGYAFIQNEYCDLGNLEEYVKNNVGLLSENLLRSLLLQMTQALTYIHSKGLAHMDIKPANIFLKSDCNENDDSGVDEKVDNITFKLGDFGHVTSLDEENDIEEGDCRYIPRELLERNPTHLDKIDVFSLGLTVYEASGGGPLPKNGEEWQEIRNGKLKTLTNLSRELNNILKSMCSPKPEDRPCASELSKMLKISHYLLSHVEDDLGYYYQQYYDNHSRFEHKVTNGYYLSEILKSQSHLQNNIQTAVDSSSGYYSRELTLPNSGKRSGGTKETRLVGKKAKRSNSTMF